MASRRAETAKYTNGHQPKAWPKMAGELFSILSKCDTVKSFNPGSYNNVGSRQKSLTFKPGMSEHTVALELAESKGVYRYHVRMTDHIMTEEFVEEVILKSHNKWGKSVVYRGLDIDVSKVTNRLTFTEHGDRNVSNELVKGVEVDTTEAHLVAEECIMEWQPEYVVAYNAIVEHTTSEARDVVIQESGNCAHFRGAWKIIKEKLGQARGRQVFDWLKENSIVQYVEGRAKGTVWKINFTDPPDLDLSSVRIKSPELKDSFNNGVSMDTNITSVLEADADVVEEENNGKYVKDVSIKSEVIHKVDDSPILALILIGLRHQRADVISDIERYNSSIQSVMSQYLLSSEVSDELINLRITY